MALHSKQVPISSKNSHAARSAHAKAKQEIKTYDTSAIRPKQSKAPFIIIGIVVVAIICIVAALLFNGCERSVTPLPQGEEATIVVQEGDTARDVANALLDARLISNSDSFLNAVRELNATSSLKPGTYVLKGGMTPKAIAQSLVRGPESIGVSLTIPEGFTIKNIASELEKATRGAITAQAFMDATADASAWAADYPFVGETGDKSLEGFLFPKTYVISDGASAEDVVRMMLDQYALETQNIDWSYAQARGLSRYEALILASIVEKESKADNMPTVASVFYNRLASERPYIESDATTAYEVGHDPTPEEVHADTPYSTYSNPGLPPTPICNPSIMAIRAVCSPEETDYMFFYFDDENGYTFSETYEEHQTAFN